jgi:hypothetical protein
MKELIGHASNLILAPDLDAPPRVKARVELIVICRETAYNYGPDGLAWGQTATDVRVLCGHKALRETAQKMLKLADDAEALERSVNDAMEMAYRHGGKA